MGNKEFQGYSIHHNGERVTGIYKHGPLYIREKSSFPIPGTENQGKQTK